MQTISTKLDKETTKKFIDICNDSGKCQSEMLRDLIETMCEDLEESEIVSDKVPTITIVDV
jgi:predicted DNA-binding protein